MKSVDEHEDAARVSSPVVVPRVLKLDLQGKALETFGKLGRLPGWFDSIDAIACPNEKTIYLAHEFGYRFDKVVCD